MLSRFPTAGQVSTVSPSVGNTSGESPSGTQESKEKENENGTSTYIGSPMEPQQLLYSLTDTDLFNVAENVKMKMNSRSVQDVFDGYHGIGTYLGYPIPGGISACERRWKNKWRTGYGTGDQQYLSRVKSLCNYMEECRAKGEGKVQLAERLDKRLICECNGSINNLVELLKKDSLIQVATHPRSKGQSKRRRTTAGGSSDQ